MKYLKKIPQLKSACGKIYGKVSRRSTRDEQRSKYEEKKSIKNEKWVRDIKRNDGKI